jgi:thiosulfate dehydrogenase
MEIRWPYLTCLVLVVCSVGIVCCKQERTTKPAIQPADQEQSELWTAPDTSTIPKGEAGEAIRYGRDLIARTAYYIGPKGKLMQISNGMNCQNCHLDAGTRPWGNNYSRAVATFPKFRERSGTVETLEKRINDCIERSLNGKALDTGSKEIHAIVSYMQWLGKGVPKGHSPPGAGLKELEYLNRPADPESGRLVYEQTCKRCHGPDGAGVLNPDGVTYQYPPLWGDKSYNTGAGLFRLTRLAGYVKMNMPFDSVNLGRQLGDGDAWDVAAYVNSQPRPRKLFKQDWPNIAAKPIDHPFGPYADSFSENQHKYGPFGAIKKWKEAHPGKKPAS